MTLIFERRSLEMTVEHWRELERLAAATDSVPPRGPNVSAPSWRTLVKRIAAGELKVNEGEAGEDGE